MDVRDGSTYHDVVHVVVEVGLAAELLFQLHELLGHLVVAWINVVHGVKFNWIVELRELKLHALLTTRICNFPRKGGVLGGLQQTPAISTGMFIDKVVCCN